MPYLRIRLTLPEGTNEQIVIVGGGVDLDDNGRVEDNKEMLTFERERRSSYVWIASTKLTGSTKDRLFAVVASIGRGVRWQLEITRLAKEDDEEGTVVYSAGFNRVLRTAALTLRLTDLLAE